VVEVDDHKIASGKPGEVTRLLQGAFDDAIHGRSEPYREWLDPVSAPAPGASAANGSVAAGVPLGGSTSS
jgi:hypothetical protein